MSNDINPLVFFSLTIDKKYEILINIINRAAENSIPKRISKELDAFRCNPWWDDDCKKTSKSIKTGL